MAKLLHIFYHKEGTFSLLCQQVQLITVSGRVLLENSDALTTSSSWNLSPQQDTKSFSWTGVSHDDELNRN